jgi:hypothetical protein
MQWATGGANAENSTLIKSGSGVLTLATAANTMTLTLGASGGTLNLAGGTLTLGPDLTTSGAGSKITLAAGAAYTLTIAKAGTAVVGSGAANQLGIWSDANTQGGDAGLTFDGELHLTGRYWSEGASAGYVIDDRDGSGQWMMYAINDVWYVSSTSTGTNRFGVSASAITPGGTGGTVDLGSSSNYFNVMYGTTLRLGGTQVLGSRKTGWSAWTGTATRSSRATASVTLVQLAEAFKALTDDLIAHGTIGS